MSADRGKPRLVFFQWDHSPNAGAANYLLLHMQQHVKCLATHFDVVVVNRDCDYAEICDRHEPDIALFEGGYRSHGSRRLKIGNTGANPHIPKIGLHNADAWCDRRAGFLSDMEQWGIETCFSIGTLTPHYMPELAQNLFVWPNFIDPAVFRDYGQHKVVPVTLTGQVYGLYPWRQSVFPLIRDRYPCLVSPQCDYASAHAAHLLSGEAYARALNASFVVPTCGTMGGEVVRKHFEIPAARACLITEPTPALAAAGFVDMENCVFADHRNVVERLDYLFAHPREMSRITDAGHALVHSRHTLQNRPQIHQWFMLNKDLRPNEKIVQEGPFGDLIKVDGACGRESVRVACAARDRSVLAQADACLAQDRIEEAERLYARCLDYVSYLPEARFGLARCALHRGDADRACKLVAELIEITTVEYGAADPDPVEWSCFLLALICRGERDRARRLLDFYPRLSHRELRRVRGVLDRRMDERSDTPASFGDRKSIHRLPEWDDAAWFAWFAGILDRCGRVELADELRGKGDAAANRRPPVRHSPRAVRAMWFYAGVGRLAVGLLAKDGVPNVPAMPEFRYLRHLARSLVPPARRKRLRKIRDAALALSGRVPEIGRAASTPPDARP
jgi:hypothetical protein